MAFKQIYPKFTVIGSLLILLVYFTGRLLAVSSPAELEGPNVCRRLEEYVKSFLNFNQFRIKLKKTANLFRYTIQVVTTENQAYQERVNSWCWSVPPRCSKYKIKFKTVNKTQDLPKTRIVRECCAGYGKNVAGTQCIPVCTEPCKNGVCAAPDHCQCEPGYGGPACDISKFFVFENYDYSN